MLKPRSPVRATVRGVLAVLGNPLLSAAEFLFLLATAICFLAAGAASVFLGRRFFPEVLPGTRWQETVLSVLEGGGRNLLVIFLILTVLSVGVLALAAFVKAGLCGAFLAADQKAPPESRRPSEFKVSPGLFLETGRRYFSTFFWLLNLYVLVVSIPVSFFLVALLLLVAGIIRENWIPGAVAVAVTGISTLVTGIASRLLLLAACREAVTGNNSMTHAVKGGIRGLRQTIGHSLALLCLTSALSGVFGAIFSLPRIFFELASPGMPNLWIWGGIFVFCQLVAYAAAELLQVASFLSLWNGPEETGIRVPPVAFLNTLDSENTETS